MHLSAIHHIIKYLLGTCNRGLFSLLVVCHHNFKPKVILIGLDVRIHENPLLAGVYFRESFYLLEMQEKKIQSLNDLLKLNITPYLQIASEITWLQTLVLELSFSHAKPTPYLLTIQVPFKLLQTCLPWKKEAHRGWLLLNLGGLRPQSYYLA